MCVCVCVCVASRSTPEAAAPLSIVAVKKEAAKPATKPVLHYFAGN